MVKPLVGKQLLGKQHFVGYLSGCLEFRLLLMLFWNRDTKN